MQKFIDLRTGREFAPRSPSVLCLGTFDGVHLGHMALIREALQQKKLLSERYPDIVGGAWCFSQPPADFLMGAKPRHILTTGQKLELFANAGLDIAIVGDFPAMRDIDKDRFIREILIDNAKCIKSVCGENFRFGRGALGYPEDLSAIPLGNIRIGTVTNGGETVSSSRIRAYIASGDIERANEMLGRPYFIELPVLHGKTLGRELGAPTANQRLPEGSIVPAHGVYVTRATVNGHAYPAITNIGTNPTVSDGEDIKVETHILGFFGDLYGDTIKTEFVSFLRSEKKIRH